MLQRKVIVQMNNYYKATIISYIILVLIVCLFPIGFSEYRSSDSLAPFWYWITMTGGVYGSAVIILFLLIYLHVHFKKKSKKLTNVYFLTGIVIAVQILSAASTLYFVKDVFHNPRPSQLYFVEKGFIEKGGKVYFAMPPDEKKIYLQKRIDDNAGKLEDIYPPILNSWINDNGFSFPSGHAQTSFFLGSILAFVIYKTYSQKYYFIYPLVWAILVGVSRVVIGVHYPFDVSAGAFIGLVTGLLIISLKKVSSIFD